MSEPPEWPAPGIPLFGEEYGPEIPMPKKDGITLSEFADRIAYYARAPAVAYLRGAEAALKSDPADVKLALQLLAQALGTLEEGQTLTARGSRKKEGLI